MKTSDWVIVTLPDVGDAQLRSCLQDRDVQLPPVRMHNTALFTPLAFQVSTI
jgi:hypothetical protein